MVASPNAHAPMFPRVRMSLMRLGLHTLRSLAPMLLISPCLHALYPPSRMPMPPIPLFFFLCQLNPLCHRGYGHTSIGMTSPILPCSFTPEPMGEKWGEPPKYRTGQMLATPMAPCTQCPCPYVPMYPWPSRYYLLSISNLFLLWLYTFLWLVRHSW